MSRLDDRLTRELERAARPASPAGAFERVDLRRGRRARLRKVQSGALIVVVLAGTVGGIAVLRNAFREPDDGIGDTPVVGNGAIVYSEIRNAGEHLWLVQPDGTGAQQITTDEGVSDSSAAVSPDGQTIAFMRTGGSGSSIYTVRIDGDGLTRLTHAPAMDPAWSPDGSQIAFAGGAFGPYGIWIMNADGTDPTLIPGTDELDVSHPTWSPDGTMIAFAGNSTGGSAPTDWDIWTTDLEGFAGTNITAGSGGGLSPSWSPDGSLILFARASATEGASLMTIVPDADASPIPLTDGTTLDQNPSWSPDGSRVLFDRTWAGGTDVYTMRLDGTDLMLVARNATSPAWQPVPTELDSLPVPSPTPTGGGSVDIGLGFPTCNVESFNHDFDGDGLIDTAWTATKAPDVGPCPTFDGSFTVVAVDVTGDGVADGSAGPLEHCIGCHPFAAVDLDADGIDELVVAHTGRLGDPVRIVLDPTTIARRMARRSCRSTSPPPGHPDAGFKSRRTFRLLGRVEMQGMPRTFEVFRSTI